MAKDRALSVELVDDELVIRIGVSTLCFAVANSNAIYTETGDAPTVTDEAVFSQAILDELRREEEDGTTLVHRMLDKAAVEAVESGAEGLKLPGER